MRCKRAKAVPCLEQISSKRCRARHILNLVAAIFSFTREILAANTVVGSICHYLLYRDRAVPGGTSYISGLTWNHHAVRIHAPTLEPRVRLTLVLSERTIRITYRLGPGWLAHASSDLTLCLLCLHRIPIIC